MKCRSSVPSTLSIISLYHHALPVLDGGRGHGHVRRCSWDGRRKASLGHGQHTHPLTPQTLGWAMQPAMRVGPC